ncbi:MAG: hypothetical protein GXP45_06780 [bacterium]|nr:hypothetical protein [bacterium]
MKEKLQRLSDLHRIGVVGNYGKSSLSYLLKQSLGSHKAFQTSRVFSHFTGFLQSLKKLPSTSNYIISEFGIQKK